MKPAFTRRAFLQSSLAVVSTAATMPLFVEQSALAIDDPADGKLVKSKPGVPDDRILVIVQLSGGNDGLNTVVPFGRREYYNARPVLSVPQNQVHVLDDQAGIGLHPEMSALREMIGDKRASVVVGVGYPNPNRSHFTSMDIWHTADPRGGKGLGWIGKALDQSAEQNGGHLDATACVCIGRESPLAAEGRRVKPVSFENANLFRWAGADLHAALGPEYDKLNRSAPGNPAPAPAPAPGSQKGDGSQLSFVMRTALDAQLASDRIRAAVAQGPQARFPGGQLSEQLRMVAAMIRAELPTRVYYVTLGGFDTHAGQPQRHGQLLRQFSESVRAFYNELDAIGQSRRVLTMAFSEFGRRVAQNASNGTDHGTAGPLFLFGDMVKPGLLGEYPSLEPARLDEGDLVHNVDFRNIYATVLEGWMKVDSKKVLGSAFKPANLLSVKAAG